MVQNCVFLVKIISNSIFTTLDWLIEISWIFNLNIIYLYIQPLKCMVNSEKKSPT